MHLLGDLLGGEVDHVDFGGETGHLIEGTPEGLEADTTRFHLSVVEDEDPFVGFTVNTEGADVLEDLSE